MEEVFLYAFDKCINMKALFEKYGDETFDPVEADSTLGFACAVFDLDGQYRRVMKKVAYIAIRILSAVTAPDLVDGLLNLNPILSVQEDINIIPVMVALSTLKLMGLVDNGTDEMIVWHDGGAPGDYKYKAKVHADCDFILSNMSKEDLKIVKEIHDFYDDGKYREETTWEQDAGES